nr:hypothetical protein CFP56_42847 [Quercus suber]
MRLRRRQKEKRHRKAKRRLKHLGAEASRLRDGDGELWLRRQRKVKRRRKGEASPATWTEIHFVVVKVRNILDEDVEANKMSLDGWCPRYSLSRKAKKKTLEIDRLLNDAAQFVT